MRWTDEHEAFLRETVPGRSSSEIIEAFNDRFGVTITKTQLSNAKCKYGIKSDFFPTRFKHGDSSWNKGKRWEEIYSEEVIEAKRKTLFKKGEVHVAKSRQRPIGYERVNDCGYIEVKVRDGHQNGRKRLNYVAKHRHVWEQANGRKVPDGHVVVFADKDNRNFDPSNLVLLPKNVWARIVYDGSMYTDADTLQTLASNYMLKGAICEAIRRGRTCKECGVTFDAKYNSQVRCDACMSRRRAAR